MQPDFIQQRDMFAYLNTNNKTPRKYYFTPLAVDLIDKMLTLDPMQRISCKDALAHAYLVDDEPKPLQTEALPRRSVPNYACVTKKKKQKIDKK